MSAIEISTIAFLVDFDSESDNFPVARHEKIRALWFWVLLAAVACPSRVFCQDPQDYVPGLPYTAQVVGTGFQTLADGTRVRYEDRLVWMRDSQGRTCIEVFPEDDSNCCNGKPDSVNLYIPLRHQFIQLFPGKTASVATYSVPVPTHGKTSERPRRRALAED